jgi:hypothetical protein
VAREEGDWSQGLKQGGRRGGGRKERTVLFKIVMNRVEFQTVTHLIEADTEEEAMDGRGTDWDKTTTEVENAQEEFVSCRPVGE